MHSYVCIDVSLKLGETFKLKIKKNISAPCYTVDDAGSSDSP